MEDYFARVPMAYRPLLETARMQLPETVARLIAPRYLIGFKPSFVCIHDGDMAKTYPNLASEGHTYDNCAHVCYTHHADGKQTVIFPDPPRYSDPVETLLHEIGHLFDEATNYELDAPVTTAYSETDRYERVAEAFWIVLMPPSGEWQEFVSCESLRPLRHAMGV